INVHWLRVVGLDHVQNRRELAHRGLRVFRRPGGGPHRGAVNPTKYGGCEENGNDHYDSATILIHPDLTRPATGISLANPNKKSSCRLPSITRRNDVKPHESGAVPCFRRMNRTTAF